MNIDEIKAAVDAGKPVRTGNDSYHVIKDCHDQYLIICTRNDYCIGLHGLKGTEFENHLNASPESFYIATDEADEETPTLKACKECGSTNFFYDAVADQFGQLVTIHDHFDCGDCEAERPELVEVPQ